MAQETKYATSHITGNCTTPGNATGAPDATWTADVGAADWTSRWQMDSHTGTLTGTQTIEVRVRKVDSSGTPSTGGGAATLAVNLYENGGLVQTISSAAEYDSTDTYTSGTFDASALGSQEGADVEIEVVVSGAGGGPNQRSYQIDTIRWTVNYSTGTTHQLTSTSATTTTTVAPGPHRVRPFAGTSATAVTTVAAVVGKFALAATAAAAVTTVAPGPQRVRPLTSTCAVSTTTVASGIQRTKALTSTCATATTTVAPGPHRIRPITSTSATAVSTTAALAADFALTGTSATATSTVAPGPLRIRPFAGTAAAAVTTTAILTEVEGSNNQIEGVTYDVDGTELGSVECYLWKDNLDDTLTFVDMTTSNAVTGAYLFENIADTDAQYLVYAIKEDSPHVFDVTDHVCQPATSPSESYDLYLRSDSDKGETSPDADLRLRSDDDKLSDVIQLTATANVATTTVAALNAKWELAGTAAAAVTTTAPGPIRVQPVTSTAAVTTTTVAPGPHRIRSLTSTAATAVTTTSTLAADLVMSGTAAATTTTVAALVGVFDLSATATTTTTTVGALVGELGLTGTAAVQTSTTAQHVAVFSLAGTAQVETVTTANLSKVYGSLGPLRHRDRMRLGLGLRR